MLFISFHTGPSTDPLVLSLGIPPSVAAPAQIVLVLLVGALGAVPLDHQLLRTSRSRVVGTRLVAAVGLRGDARGRWNRAVRAVAVEATQTVGHALSSRAFRIAALLVLLGWAGVD